MNLKEKKLPSSCTLPSLITRHFPFNDLWFRDSIARGLVDDPDALKQGVESGCWKEPTDLAVDGIVVIPKPLNRTNLEPR